MWECTPFLLDRAHKLQWISSALLIGNQTKTGFTQDVAEISGLILQNSAVNEILLFWAIIHSYLLESEELRLMAEHLVAVSRTVLGRSLMIWWVVSTTSGTNPGQMTLLATMILFPWNNGLALSLIVFRVAWILMSWTLCSLNLTWSSWENTSIDSRTHWSRKNIKQKFL